MVLKFPGTPNRYSFLLLFLPIIYIFLFWIPGYPFYLTSIDSEYAYLFNGLNISRFRFNLGHIDHPGTPLQYIVAINIWVRQLFHMDKSIIENVVSNPEAYLRSVYFSIIFLNGFSILFLGIIIQKAKGLTLAIIFQFLPFSAFQNLMQKGRIIPETLQLFSVIMFVIILFMYLYRKNYRFHENRYTLLFSLVTSFGVAVKIVFAPFLLVPLIILNRKEKLKYLLFFVISFLIIAIPVMVRYKKFYRWIRNLFIHQGIYGQGEKGFSSWTTITENLNLLFEGNKMLFIIQVITLILIIILLLFRKKFCTPCKIVYKMMFSSFISMLIIVLMTSKHFHAHYIVPINAIMFFQAFLILYIVTKLWLKKQQNGITTIGLSILIIVIVVNVFKTYSRKVNSYDKSVQVLNKTRTVFDSQPKNIPCFINMELYGDACVEPAIYFGFLWAGKHRNDYIPALIQQYPNSIIFDNYYKKFMHWYTPLDTMEVRDKSQNGALIYMGNDHKQNRQIIFNQVREIYNTNLIIDTIFRNSQKKEAIYKVNFTSD